jgi:hypothetical protein
MGIYVLAGLVYRWLSFPTSRYNALSRCAVRVLSRRLGAVAAQKIYDEAEEVAWRRVCKGI